MTEDERNEAIDAKAVEVFDALMAYRAVTEIQVGVLAKLIASLMVEVEELKNAAV